MTQSEMFGSAKWIDCPDGETAPIFIKTFNAAKGENAEIIICGLGVFDLYINKKRVSDELLMPAASNYSYRDMSAWAYPLFDKMSFRTYCVKYDVSNYLTEGENNMCITLGTGYYHQNMRQAEGNVDYGTPKLCYLIKKSSGDVISDSATLCHKGYFNRCNLYYGEFQDYSKIPNKADFSESREISAPETDFYLQLSPADKVIESITDIKHIGDYDGAAYYDCGKNTVGRAVVECGKANEHITVDYAEEIGGGFYNGIHFDDDGRYRDEFITDGINTEYTTRFGWQGFRYFRVYGNAEPLRVEVIHSDIKITSAFECDNETLNWLYNAYVYTQLCNMHCGVPSDCPHRERLGYTGDGQLCAESAMLLLDSREFYRKWLYDIADCQCKDSGHVQHTAPAMGGGGGPCGWGGAIVEVPYRYYKIFGDVNVLEEFFPKMLRFFDYLESRSENGLVCREEKDGWCLGDWLPPEPISLPETYVNSCLYVRFMQQALEIAGIIGRESEAEHLKCRIQKVKNAINVAYYSIQQHAYCGDTDGASCFALQIGLGDADVRQKVIKKYSSLGEYDTGIIATEILTRYLFETGDGQLAYNLMTNDKDVSFSHMMKSGADTLWENWDGASSRNHPMFGAVTKLLFTELLGIRQPDNSCGFKKVTVSPVFVAGMNSAKGELTTVSGKISVEYVKANGRARINVFADSGIDAEFSYKNFTQKFSGNAEFTIDL